MVADDVLIIGILECSHPDCYNHVFEAGGCGMYSDLNNDQV